MSTELLLAGLLGIFIAGYALVRYWVPSIGADNPVEQRVERELHEWTGITIDISPDSDKIE